ncbi:MAG TPA: DUF1501 domain-containing protein [Pirellulales bacterium]|nr:DUF1501 domain-containing protein [Pirellulales bacterium]
MPNRAVAGPVHPPLTRRSMVQAGSIGLLGLGLNYLEPLRSALAATPETKPAAKARAAIFIFLSGGLGQHDSFDLKPDAPDNIRGEFKPIATRTPGVRICEHLPRLAERSHLWALVRSLTHPSNDHSAGHHIMLTGRSDLPPGFDPGAARPADWPSLAAVAGYATTPRNNLPPAVVLPERLLHNSGRTIPGQFAGILGSGRDPWFVEASPFHSTAYGAYPEYGFDHQERGHADRRLFQAPNLTLPQGIDLTRFGGRVSMLAEIERQRRRLDALGESIEFDRYRHGAISLLADGKVQWAFDVTRADEPTQMRYGRNSFGWSLLMARRLVEAGVNLVQVNLGNNETWDTHGEAFPHLKDKLFPPTDQALSALLDDLHDSGLLDTTLIVMAGEFGRTPKITHLPQFYKLPGRDHWGAVQTVFFAGGGVRGGTVIGASDKIGAFPASQPQRPENMAATIYQSLGIPALAVFHDALDRPHAIYHADPISGLTG